MRYRVLWLLLIIGLMMSLPGAANTQVDVTLVISNWSYQLEETSCTVTVPAGSDGLAVLDAAKTSGCIASYTAVYYPEYNDSFIDCINDRCTESVPPFRAWTMRENCVLTSYGAQGYSADHGDELSFTYETIATFFAPAIC